MGTNISRREPEVHVVVVQSQENGKVDAKVLRKTYTKVRTSQRKEKQAAHASDSESLAPDEDFLSTQSPRKKPSKAPRPYPRHPRHGYDDMRPATDNSTPGATPDHPVYSMLLGEGQRKRFSSHPSPLAYSNSFPSGSVQKLTSPNSAIMDSASGRKVRREESHVKEGLEEQSPTGEMNGRSMFELFRTYDGEEYTVYMRDDGKRFYVDWEEQKWRYFPTSWEERGYFLPIDYDPYQGPESEKQFTDSRSGEFIHPTKGKLVTYLRQETQNVLYFLDEVSGSWLPMPLNWERHVPNISSLIEKVQRTCPSWKDIKSIVALLRQCNYNVEDCISTYISLNDDGVLDCAEGSGRDILRAKTEKKLEETTSMLSEVKERNRELRTQINILQNRIEELEMENQGVKQELERKTQGQKRISKVYQKQSSTYHPHLINPIAVQPLLRILSDDTQAMRAKMLALRNSMAKGFSTYRLSFKQLSITIGQLLRVHKSQAREISEVRTLYHKEALQRKLLYNEVQELRGNIRVFCRCRFDSSGPCSLKFDGDNMVVCTTAQGRKKAYEFEKLFPPDTTQEEVFQDTKPIITSCVDGYNVCIIAYGQTGAGKTYTMMGTLDRPGVNIRSMKELFKICHERTKVKYTMKVSIVEVYNEAVFDLLVPPSEGHEKLQIVKKGKETVVQGLTEIEVRSMDDVLMVMREGEQNRTVADTKMNTNSSRSHQLLMLKVDGYDRVSKTTSHGRLALVDLAGSERISRSEATGIRLVEAASINKSLSALGQVFASIRNNALHVPYRNSKLTFLLQPSVGGDSKVCMFVNISPLASNMAETVSTLEFGQNVRQVELGQATKHITK